MFARLQHFFAPPTFNDEDDTRKAALLNLIMLVIVISDVIYLTVSAVLALDPTTQWLLLAAVLPLWFGFRWLLQQRRLHLISIALVSVGCLLATLLAIVAGGVHEHAFNVSLISICLAGLLLGSRWATGVAGVSAGAELLVLWATTHGYLSPHPQAPTPVGLWLSEALTFGIVVVLIHFVANNLQAALTRAGRGERALLTSNQALQARTTDLERLSVSLHESQGFNQAILNSVMAHIAVLDQSGVIVAVNQAWERFARQNGDASLGHTSIGANYLAVCQQAAETSTDPQAAHDAQVSLNGLQAVMSGAQTDFTLEYPCHSPTEQGWFILYATPLMLDGGGVVVSHVNITKRKLAEAALRESESRFRAFFESTTVGATQLNPATGEYLAVNEKFCQITGYSKEELLAMTLADFTYPDDRKRDEEMLSAVRQGAQREYITEKRYLRKDGQLIWCQVAANAVYNAAGQIAYSAAIVEDITARKQAEEKNAQLLKEIEQQRTQLRVLNRHLAENQESERKAMARELHDRVGQSLTALGINLHLVQAQLARQVPKTDRAYTYLNEAQAMITETTDQIRDVMADLRPPMLDRYGLLAALQWYATLLIKRTGLQVAVHDEAATRLAEQVELTLFRVVQEALTNVVKHAQATQATVTFQMEAGLIRLIIADNGRGIEPAQAESVDISPHWGLLAIRERVEAVNGNYRLESHPGEGTTVIIELKE